MNVSGVLARCEFRGLPETEGGIVTRHFIAQADAKAIALEQGDNLFGQDPVLENTAAESDLVDARVGADPACLLEKGLGSTKPGYGEYVRRTSAFVPWPPKA